MAGDRAQAVFSGVGVALVTLFHKDGSLDAAATAEHAERLVGLGVRAVLVAGTTGEAAALEPAERDELVTALRKVLPDGGAPLLVGTGAPSLRQALRHTRAACDLGADAVLALSLPGESDLAGYYGALREAAGTVPLLAYHYPNASAPGIPVALLRRLDVDGCKDSSGDANRLLETLTTWDRPLYTGSSAVLSLAGPLGCAGAILSLANAEPEECIAAFAGDHAAQLRLAGPHLASRARFPAGVKELTAARFPTATTARLG